MADGGEQVSRALALMDQFYVSMMESGVLKILAFQYECFAEITEDTYLKFLTNFSALATAVKTLNDEIFTTERVDVACQTAKVSLPGNTPLRYVKPAPVLEPLKVQKVKLHTDDAKHEPRTVTKIAPKGRVGLTKREPMICDYCEQKFTTLENFELHIRQVHGEQFSRSFFSCEICNQHFLSSETLYEHISCAHQLNEEDEAIGDQLCAYCAEITSTWQEMEDHCIEKHSAYMCKTCHIMCDTQDKLEEHMATHLIGVKPEMIVAIPSPPRPVGRPPSLTSKSPVIPKPPDTNPRKRGRPRKPNKLNRYIIELPCKFCKLTFSTDESLKQHIMKRHEPLDRKLVCKKCNLKFRRRPALENHMRMVHKKYESSESEEEKEVCEIILAPVSLPNDEEQKIPAPTKVPTKRATPIAAAPKSKQTNVVRSGRLHCEVCGELCAKAEDQEIHKDHHATRKKDHFLCLYCKAPSMSQHELRTHIVSEHRYRCPFCSLTFWWKTNLESHLQQLHNSKDECPKCLTKAMGDELRQHVLQQHTPRKLYICKICDAEHFTVKALHEHEMTHAKKHKEGITCDLCQRIFYTRSRLRGHLLRHLHGSFCCYLCGQQCQTQDQLQEHLTRHRKSQFACFCGQRFVKKSGLQIHQRSNICKQGVASGPKADIFVEVCVPGEEEDIEESNSLLNATKLERLSEGDESHSNVWQINIALPAETPDHLSRDFLTALAHSVRESQVQIQDNVLVGSENQPILILDANSDATEATVVSDQPAEIVKWMQDQGVTITTTENADTV